MVNEPAAGNIDRLYAAACQRSLPMVLLRQRVLPGANLQVHRSARSPLSTSAWTDASLSALSTGETGSQPAAGKLTGAQSTSLTLPAVLQCRRAGLASSLSQPAAGKLTGAQSTSLTLPQRSARLAGPRHRRCSTGITFTYASFSQCLQIHGLSVLLLLSLCAQAGGLSE